MILSNSVISNNCFDQMYFFWVYFFIPLVSSITDNSIRSHSRRALKRLSDSVNAYLN